MAVSCCTSQLETKAGWGCWYAQYLITETQAPVTVPGRGPSLAAQRQPEGPRVWSPASIVNVHRVGCCSTIGAPISLHTGQGMDLPLEPHCQHAQPGMAPVAVGFVMSHRME